MPELPPDDELTVEFAKGVKFGIELIMEAQTRTISEALAEIEGVPDDTLLTAGSVKEMLRAFTRSNEGIAADTNQTLGDAIEGEAANDPREEGEDDE